MEGERFEGVLQDSDNEKFTLFIRGTKKTAPEVLTFNYADVKSTKVIIKF